MPTACWTSCAHTRPEPRPTDRILDRLFGTRIDGPIGSRAAATAAFEGGPAVVREIFPLGIQALQPRSPGFGPRAQLRHIVTTAGTRTTPSLPEALASVGSTLFVESATFTTTPPTPFAHPDQLFTLFGREKLTDREHRLQAVLPML
jgi:hypothetical protein